MEFIIWDSSQVRTISNPDQPPLWIWQTFLFFCTKNKFSFKYSTNTIQNHNIPTTPLPYAFKDTRTYQHSASLSPNLYLNGIKQRETILVEGLSLSSWYETELLNGQINILFFFLSFFSCLFTNTKYLNIREVWLYAR